jgi:transposase
MWARIAPLMPADPVRGRRWADHRRTLEAIAWKYRTSSPWRDPPAELGSFQTAHSGAAWPCDKLANTYRAAHHLSAIPIWARR